MPDLSKSKFTTENKTVTSTSAGASADVVYTVPDNHSAIVRFLHLSNGTASTKKAHIQIYHNDTTSYFTVVNGLSMTANTTHNVVSGNLQYLLKNILTQRGHKDGQKEKIKI